MAVESEADAPSRTIRQRDLRKPRCGKDLQKKTFKTSDNCSIAYTLRPARQARRAAIGAHPFLGAGWQHLGRRRGKIGRPGRDPYLRLPRARAIGAGSGSFTTELFASDLAELLDHLGWPDRRCRRMLHGRLRRAGICRPESLPRERARTDRHDGMVRRRCSQELARTRRRCPFERPRGNGRVSGHAMVQRTISKSHPEISQGI